VVGKGGGEKKKGNGVRDRRVIVKKKKKRWRDKAPFIMGGRGDGKKR